MDYPKVIILAIFAVWLVSFDNSEAVLLEVIARPLLVLFVGGFVLVLGSRVETPNSLAK